MSRLLASVNFFVSYASADRPWAEWIAWELEYAGYSVIVQAWEMQPGSNFVQQIDRAQRVAERTIAVLSPAFLDSPYCRAEWGAAFRMDPTGRERGLVPVRVRQCEPSGLLGQVVYVDLVGLSEDAARNALLAAVGKRARPPASPRWRGEVQDFSGLRVRRPEPGAAIFNVPVMTHTFVGRNAELARLARGLEGEGVVGVTQVHTIHGMGGVGKTQLAARYARTHREDYDVIWWLRAEQPATLRADLAELAVELGLIDVDVDEDEAIAATRGWLERNSRWLLVFDNASAPGAIADLVPEGMGGHVVITSRAHPDWRSLNARLIALNVWERKESQSFLAARTGEHDDGVLDRVADALGDLPLALEQAAAYTNTVAISLSEYLRRLRDRAPELFAAGQPVGYEHTVATVWQLAFDRIAEDPVAGGLLVVCAHLAPERIPRELLQTAGETTGTPQTTAMQIDAALTLLLAYAVLTRSDEQTFVMHRLIAQLTRDATDAAAHARAVSAAVSALDESWPARPWEHEQWPACERLLAHAITATDHSEHHDAGREQTASLLVRMGQYQQALGELAMARQLTQRALTIEEAVYGPEHPDVAGTLTNLGVVQGQLGEFEAARVTLQRALTIKEAVYGPEHPDVAGTLTNLGIVQRQLGEFEAARASQQRALTIFEAVYGPEHQEVAIMLTNLGDVQRQLGEPETARASHQRALAIKEAIYGPEHPEVARTLTNLGAVLEELGELEAARATHHRALAINESAYGPDHPEVARTLTNLGTVLEQLRELEAARATRQRALAIEEAVYGPEHPDVAITLGDLGSVQAQLGELEAARASHRRALAINKACYGAEHPEVGRTLANLGVVLEQLGHLEEARACQQRALAINELVYGRDHPEVATALGNLGIVLEQLGELEAARSALARAGAIKETVGAADGAPMGDNPGGQSTRARP
jgi:tetratricopeptide (TPR) repeat protein